MMRNIGFEEMESLIDDYEDQQEQQPHDQQASLLVLDVRTEPEVQATGSLSDHTITLPLQTILNHNIFALTDEDFEEIAGFAKPPADATLVFSCAAGIRSVYACQAAAAAGYSRLVNYAGGANEWFSRKQR
jgi:rhodanese-related sulfurtransferase